VLHVAYEFHTKKDEVIEMANKTATRGRPPADKFEGKHAPLSLRITKEMQGKLERAARGNRRPLSREVRARLDASLDDEERRARLARADHINKLGTIMMMVAERIEGRTGKPFIDDAYTAKNLCDAAEFIIRHFGAKSEVVVPTAIAEAAAQNRIEGASETLTPSGIRRDEAIGWEEAGHVVAAIEMWHYRDLNETLNLVNPKKDYAPADWTRDDNLARSFGLKRKRIKGPDGLWHPAPDRTK
jgi:hypothetical protein